MIKKKKVIPNTWNVELLLILHLVAVVCFLCHLEMSNMTWKHKDSTHCGNRRDSRDWSGRRKGRIRAAACELEDVIVGPSPGDGTEDIKISLKIQPTAANIHVGLFR